jgi:serine/threonine protein kinase
MLSQGQIVNNRYRVVKALAQGGFGVVYRVWDISLNHTCALKENKESGEEYIAQFQQEAIFLSNLNHPHLPRVTDYFILPGEGQYLVMDFIEGDDLQGMLGKAGTALDERKAMPWILDVCDALIYMHTQNPPIIHRDIKPANIRITSDGNAMLVDFGIAKRYDPNLRTVSAARAVSAGYSPYEQYGQGRTDARSDVYALGATVYALLTGQEPADSLARATGVPLADPRTLNPRISPGVGAAILKAMELQPDKRFQTMAELRAQLAGNPAGRAAAEKIPSGPHQDLYQPASFQAPASTMPEAYRPQPMETGFTPGMTNTNDTGVKNKSCILLGGVGAGVLVVLGVVIAIIVVIFAFPGITLPGTAPTPGKTLVSASTATPFTRATEVPLPTITLSPSFQVLPSDDGTPGPGTYLHLGDICTWDPPPISPGVYTYPCATVPQGKFVSFTMSWCAAAKSILDNNWADMLYELTIDDVPVDLDTHARFFTHDSDIGPCNGYRGYIQGFTPGIHHVVWTHHIYHELSDGQDTFVAGDYVMDHVITVP